VLGLYHNGRPEGVDGTTHLIRQFFELTPPASGWTVTSAVLEMWADNKVAWYWDGALVMDQRQGPSGAVELFPAHVRTEGGTYLLAMQNSNDYMYVENPQATAYRLCVTWQFGLEETTIGYFLPLVGS
jgi:hypothetical protein